MPPKNEKPCKLLIGATCLILLVLLSATSSSILRGEGGYVVALHFAAILLFLLGVAMLRISTRNISMAEEASRLHELMELQAEIDKNTLRYKSLMEGASDAIFVINPDNGFIEEMNRRATELLGYTGEELGTLASRSLIPKEEQPKFTSLVRRVKRRGMAKSEAITFKRREGGSFLGEINARLIDLPDQKLVQATIRDITFKHRAEKEVRQRNRELSILNNIIARANESLQLQAVLDITLQETLEVFNADGGAIHLMDHEGKTLQLAATLGISPELAAGIEQLALDGDPPCHLAANHHCHTIEDPSKARCKLAKLSVAEDWTCFASAPLLAKNLLVGVLHVMTRTERRFTNDEMRFFATIGNQIGIVIEHARLFEELNTKTEELLRSHRLLEKSSRQLALSQNKLQRNLALVERANLEMERLDKMKNHFLGMMSHEFKTPLTSIMSGAQYLLACMADGGDREDRKVLEMVYKGGMRLNEMLNDLLKVAKLEARNISLTKTPINLTELLQQVLEHIEPLVQERRHKITICDMNTLPSFQGDREYLEEVFTNLLENSVKFTPNSGEIHITAILTDRSALQGKREILARFNKTFMDKMGERQYIQLEVRDSGIGIDFPEQVKIFDKFYEVGEIRHHSTGKHKFQGKGAGLGLAIVKGMVEAHDGMAWVESAGASQESGGSSFFILLPLEEGVRQSTFSFMQGEGFPSEPLAARQESDEEP